MVFPLKCGLHNGPIFIAPTLLFVKIRVNCCRPKPAA
jgi:hypothetical protein